MITLSHFFFFSSRRRHTRSLCDWSSDVCSSDLADSGGYKPLNWMTPATVIEERDDRIVVRKRAGKTEDRLEIRIAEVLSDLDVPMDEVAGLEKDGVEKH